MAKFRNQIENRPKYGSIRSQDEYPLHEAAYYNDVEYAKYLLEEYGIDANSIGIAGDTPLHVAASRNCLEMAEFLLEHGANLNLINKSGLIPLRMAIRLEREYIKDLFLDWIIKDVNLCNVKKYERSKYSCANTLEWLSVFTELDELIGRKTMCKRRRIE